MPEGVVPPRGSRVGTKRRDPYFSSCCKEDANASATAPPAACSSFPRRGRHQQPDGKWSRANREGKLRERDGPLHVPQHRLCLWSEAPLLWARVTSIVASKKQNSSFMLQLKIFFSSWFNSCENSVVIFVFANLKSPFCL